MAAVGAHVLAGFIAGGVFFVSSGVGVLRPGLHKTEMASAPSDSPSARYGPSRGGRRHLMVPAWRSHGVGHSRPLFTNK